MGEQATPVVMVTPAALADPARVSVSVPGEGSRRIYARVGREWIDLALTSTAGSWELPEDEVVDLARTIRDAVMPIVDHLRMSRTEVTREHAIALGLITRQTMKDWITQREDERDE